MSKRVHNQILLERFQRAIGSKEADRLFAQIAEENGGLVRRWVDRYMGLVRGRCERSDLMLEGMIGLWDAACRYDPSRRLAFSTFATPLIRGSLLDYIYRRVPIITIPEAKRQGGGGDALPQAVLVEDKHLHRAPDRFTDLNLIPDRVVISRLLSHLPERDARIFVAYHHDGESSLEIAATTGLRPQSVRDIIKRCQRKLQAHIQSHTANEETLLCR